MTRAMILAAGFGTRLLPITEFMPKPMVPVAGIPNIVRTITHLVRFGITDIVINLHHMGEVIVRDLGDGSAFGAKVTYSSEPVLLGTGGGIRKALPFLGDEPFFVINGDALFAPDLAQAMATHQKSGALATLLLRPDREAAMYGAIGVDASGYVRRIVGVGDATAVLSDYMFTGCHIIDPRMAAWLPENGCIVREAYQKMLPGERLAAHIETSPFIDLGTPTRLLQASVNMLTGKLPLSGYLPPADGIWIGQGAVVAGDAYVGEGTAICDGARVEAGARIERSIVMTGATASGLVQDAVVLPDGRVLGTPTSPSATQK